MKIPLDIFFFQKDDLRDKYRVHTHLASYEDNLWEELDNVFKTFLGGKIKEQKKGDNLTQYTFGHITKVKETSTKEALLSQLANGELTLEEFRTGCVKWVFLINNN